VTIELQVKAAIYEMGLLFNQPPNDERITAYAKALKDFTPTQICFAFNQVIKSGSAFFPSLAEILKHLQPAKESSEDLAVKAMEEVVRAVIYHGHYQTQRALDSLSESTRKIVGDDHQLLVSIGKSEASELPTLKAQLRNLFRARIESEKAGEQLIQLNRIGIKLGGGEMRQVSYE
jgi:hypothetical protein